MSLDPLVLDHARRCKRFFVWGERLYHVLPKRLHPRAARWLSAAFSPTERDLPAIWAAMQWALELSDAEAHQALDRWLANEGAWGLDIHDYPSLPSDWTERVHCDERALAREMIAQGGLLLSYHSQHHIRLCAFVGDSGTNGWPLAAPEEGSPYQPWTGRFIRQINSQCAARLGGGGFLFTDDLRRVLRQSRRGLQQRDVVGAIMDVPLPSLQTVGASIFGRELPVSTALIDLALELQVPIWTALFYSDLQGGHVVRLASMPTQEGAQGVVQAYAGQLETWLRADPWAWQGWGWWLNLAARDARVSASPQEIAERLNRFERTRPQPARAVRALKRLGNLQERWAPLMTP